MMHQRLTDLRKKYGDSDANDQKYIDLFNKALKK